MSSVAARLDPRLGRDACSVVAELERRGELWSAATGAIGLRGDALRLYRALEARIGAVAHALAPDEWLMPAVVSFETLARADYFASFPQWLTTASHLTDDAVQLESRARAADPAAAVEAATAPARAALPPAVCYHAYASLAGRALDRAVTLTAQCTCWRHEGDRTAPLERGWAFTMREAVVIGSGDEVAAFREAGLRLACALASELGLDAQVAEATDPFFAPTARGRSLIQRLKALKHELLLPVGADRRVAAASFNDHQTFFGAAFDIRLADGAPATSGCVALGVERWLLAFLVAHGTEAARWSQILPVEVA